MAENSEAMMSPQRNEMSPLDVQADLLVRKFPLEAREVTFTSTGEEQSGIMRPLEDELVKMRNEMMLHEPGEMVNPRMKNLVDEIVARKTNRRMHYPDGRWSNRDVRGLRQNLFERGVLPEKPAPRFAGLQRGFGKLFPKR